MTGIRSCGACPWISRPTKKTYSIDDQFMFGPAIMVCPVTEYMIHRPPEDSVLISPEHFKTKDGRPGLDATYYDDTEFKKLCAQAGGAEHRSLLVHGLARLHHRPHLLDAVGGQARPD